MEGNRPISDFSDDELRAYASEHVLYEITQFVRAALAVEASRVGNFPMNFAIEVFALHLRNLLDFFAPRGTPWETDALASHFYEGWEPPKLNEHLKQARWMADKHVAHLTSDRTADIHSKLWAIEPIAYTLVPIIRRFAEGAQLVTDEFRLDVGDRLSEVPPLRDWTELPPQPAIMTRL